MGSSFSRTPSGFFSEHVYEALLAAINANLMLAQAARRRSLRIGCLINAGRNH